MDQVKIIKGEDKSIVVLLTTPTSGPFDLTGATPITCCFKNATGADLVLGLGTGIAITTALAGKLTLSLTAAQTALLATFTDATLQLTITQAGIKSKIQIESAYSVVDSVC